MSYNPHAADFEGELGLYGRWVNKEGNTLGIEDAPSGGFIISPESGGHFLLRPISPGGGSMFVANKPSYEIIIPAPPPLHVQTARFTQVGVSQNENEPVWSVSKPLPIFGDLVSFTERLFEGGLRILVGRGGFRMIFRPIAGPLVSLDRELQGYLTAKAVQSFFGDGGAEIHHDSFNPDTRAPLHKHLQVILNRHEDGQALVTIPYWGEFRR